MQIATSLEPVQPAAPNNTAPTQTAMLDGPLLPLLIRLAMPTVAVLFMVTFLSVAETYFVAAIGTEAIAAASAVVPVILLMTMVSNGGIGGGVSAAIARARGAGRSDDVESLAWHSLVIAVVAGSAFTVLLWLGGPALYHWLGARGDAHRQAVLYSNILFGGAIASWSLMLLQSALRGVGNVKVPALIIAGSVVLGLLLSPALISGWYGLPRLGVAGAGVSQVLTNVVGLAATVLHMRSRNATLALRRHPLQRKHFRSILAVGLPSSLGAVMSNVALIAATAAAGRFGVAALAGYGIASRLDGLLVPVMFGFGTAALAVVGTNLGAGNVARARQAALLNALVVAAALEALGLLLAMRPALWLAWFTHDAEVLAVGSRYLQIVGPTYGLTAIALELYFAGQGAGKVGWPLLATTARLLFTLGAVLCVATGVAGLTFAFFMVAIGVAASAALTLYGFKRVSWGVSK